MSTEPKQFDVSIHYAVKIESLGILGEGLDRDELLRSAAEAAAIMSQSGEDSGALHYLKDHFSSLPEAFWYEEAIPGCTLLASCVYEVNEYDCEVVENG